MPVPVDTLRSIKNFPDLVRYLEDELDWPLQEYGFDELTFEYSPAELGLKDEDAAKVKAIHQLRPVVHGQPFGIFFVEFERKRMPVVVLRRILSHLVLKKRASANRAGAAAWDLDDLLFISAFGDEASDQREIAFAHFCVDPESPGDLPVLKVLGWDDGDTILHVAGAEKALREHLHWPEDTADLRAWRGQWASAFMLRHREVIETTHDLVEELARLATAIRRRMNAILASESSQGPIRRLHSDFRKTLIHDLSEDDFADVVAQTITYGLLAARFSRPMGISVHDLPRMVPPTNPFLRDLLEMFLEATGHTETLNFDELGIQDVVEVLNQANADAVKADFGNRTRSEDPVVHFYEHFLKAYDARRKVQRGVFYTPQPVVSYIVRSVHELLQTEFGIEDGLASTVTWGEMAARHKEMTIPDGVSPNAPFVVVLDPATGTGTFLVEVIEVIFRTLMDKWTRQRLSPAQRTAAWNAYVPEHLFPRLFGYELMMAPYAIAHMKLGLKLSEINMRLGQPDYQFRFAGRAHVYLTNALEPPHDFQDQFAFVAPALANEALAVNNIKRQQRFTVVIGNPPYSGHSANNDIKWIVDKVYDYKRDFPDLQKSGQAKWLQDDYVKFIRFDETLMESSGIGLIGLISNNGFLDNPTFKGMRRHLLNACSSVHVLDLRGGVMKREQADDGSQDQNVFDIQQSVTITLLTWLKPGESRVYYSELRGSRTNKYAFLASKTAQTTGFVAIIPIHPFYLLTPSDMSLSAEYQPWLSVADLFNQNGDPAPGIVTTQDEFAISWTPTEQIDKVEKLLATSSEQEARSLFRLCSQSQWSYHRAKLELPKTDWRSKVTPILYRPFDIRYTIYDSNIAVHRRERVSRHMMGEKNLALIFMRQVALDEEYSHFGATRLIVDNRAFYSNKGIMFLAPLYLTPEPRKDLFGADEAVNNRQPNLNPAIIDRFCSLFRLRAIDHGAGDLVSLLGPEDIFRYLFAIFHSPTYRTRYAEFLKIDFPRVPLTGSLDLFRSLAALGGELVALHLMESPALARHITTWAGPKAPQVEKVAYADGAVWVNKAQTAGFRGVPEAVWNFHIGGYQVCDKWLKDRKGRTLSAEDIEHYQRVVVALNETIRIMGEIDAVIEEHGGWPIQ